MREQHPSCPRGTSEDFRLERWFRVGSAEHVGGQFDRVGAYQLGCCRNLISCCTWPGTTLIAAGRLLGLSSTVLPGAREIRRVLVLSRCNCDDPEEPCLLFFGRLSPQGHCQTFLDAMAMASVAHKPGNINAFTPDVRQRTFGCLSSDTLIMLTKDDIDHESA